MTFDKLLDGHAPTEAWLVTEEAARILSDADRRTTLYRAMHPHPDPFDAPLLRALLSHEVAFRGDPSHDGDDRFENLYWCSLLLSRVADVRDVLALWRAKKTNFDTSAGFDVQFLVGAGVEATLAVLALSEDPAAPEAAAYISRCAKEGDFDDLDGWREGRGSYFDGL